MKKAEKLFEGRTLTASIGKAGTYQHKQMTVSGAHRGENFVFTIVTSSGSGYQKQETIQLSEVLAEMQAFSPKATSWKVSKKSKAVKAPKVKAEPEAEPVKPAMIRKGRG